MKKEGTIDNLKTIFARYIFLLVVTVFMLFYQGFYNLFLKLTIYPVNSLLSIFYNSFVYGNKILVENSAIEIIPACVAVSAYLLLAMLNLTTPIRLRKRLYSLVFSFIALLFLNILRIFFLSLLLMKDYVYFELLHKIFWYSLSIILVVAIWFLTIYLFKIKEIPVFSDFKFIYSLNKARKSKKNRK